MPWGLLVYRDDAAHGREALETLRRVLLSEARALPWPTRMDAELLRCGRAVAAPLEPHQDAAGRARSLNDLDAAIAAARLRQKPRTAAWALRIGGVCAVVVLVALAAAPEVEAVVPLDCTDSCEMFGGCVAVGDVCMATRHEHCAQSRECAYSGRCSLVDEKCQVVSDDDCRRTRGCQGSGACLKAYTPGMDTVCIAPQELGHCGKRICGFRTRKAARAAGRW